MRISPRFCAVAVSACVALLLAALPFVHLPAACTATNFAHLAGRAHPLVLHFPIALVLLAALLHATALPFVRRCVPEAPRGLGGWILGAAALSAAVAALAGWVLAQTSSQESELLKLHLFTGAGTAAAVMLAWSLRLAAGADAATFPVRTKLSVAALGAAVVLLLPAGHAGAGLTHGADYLSKYAPRWLAPLLGEAPAPKPIPAGLPAKAENQLVFRDVIFPILDRNCIGCHGEESTKGKLRLDTRTAILAGGKSGAAATPGATNAKESPLLGRMRLPLDAKGHMPPADEAQPTPAEVELLAWWVAAGLPGDVPLTQISLPARFAPPPAGK